MQPSAQTLILDILKSGYPDSCSVRYLIKCGFLFNITENTMRVTIARLTKNGTITSHSRGFYSISTQSLVVENELWNWRSGQKITTSWNGQYYAVACQSLGRSDRTALKKREKSLLLMGFASMEKDLYLRPTNLIFTPQQIQNKLTTLGLEKNAKFFTITDVNTPHQTLISDMWNTSGLMKQYQEQEELLGDWMKKQHALNQDQQLMESYLLSKRAVRIIFFDPLLPDPYIIGQTRDRFVDMARRFERNSFGIWRDFYKYY
jgi:phenylacetic acid degradation operon negative regulatory protein